MTKAELRAYLFALVTVTRRAEFQSIIAEHLAPPNERGNPRSIAHKIECQFSKTFEEIFEVIWEEYQGK